MGYILPPEILFHIAALSQFALAPEFRQNFCTKGSTFYDSCAADVLDSAIAIAEWLDHNNFTSAQVFTLSLWSMLKVDARRVRSFFWGVAAGIFFFLPEIIDAYRFSP